MPVCARGTRIQQLSIPHVFTTPQLLIESRNYGLITSYVYKAEPALDATTNSMRNINQGPTATAAPPGREKIAAEREKVQSKLDLATALAHFGQGTYDKAATYFLKIGSIRSLGPWASKVRSCSGSLRRYTRPHWRRSACRAVRYRHLWYSLRPCELPAVIDQGTNPG